MKSSNSAYARFLQRWSVWVVAAFTIALPFIGWGAMQAINANSNDVKRWLPDAYPETLSLLWYQESFGMGSDAGVVILWPDCRVKRAEEQANAGEILDADAEPVIEAHPTVAKLTALLREARLDPNDPSSPPLLARVLSGPETLEEMTRQPTPEDEDVLGLSYDEVVKRLEGSILGPDYVHGILFDLEAPTPARVAKVETETPAEEHGLEAGDEIRSINGVATPDAVSAKHALEQTYQQAGSGTLRIELTSGMQVHWDSRGPRPGRQTAVIATLSEPASRQAHLASSVGRIREITEQAGISAADLRLGGPPVDNVSIDYEGRKTLLRLALLSFGIGLAMCWICLGNIKLTLLVFFTSLYSEGTSLAVVWYSGGEVDAILMSLPTLVYLLTISGAIHIANYYRDSLAEAGPKLAPAMSVTKGFIPCILAAGTTAVGMGSLFISDLAPIRNFGLYSAVAVLTTLLWIFVYIPACLQVWPLKPKKNAMAPGEIVVHAPRRVFAPFARFFGRCGEGIIRRPNWVTGFAIITTVLFSFGIFGLNVRIGDTEIKVPSLRTSVKLMEMFSDDTRIVRDYKWIENRLAALVPMEVVISTDNSETIVVSGEAQSGSYVISFQDADGASGETEPLPWNASAAQVQAALRDAGLANAVVDNKGDQRGLAHRVTLADGGGMPLLQIETQGELTGNHVQVRHALRLVHRLQMIDQARRRILELPEVNTALATSTFAPELPPDYEPWGLRTSIIDRAMNRARPKLVGSGFFAQQKGDDLLRISLRVGAFSPVDYSHFVADIRQAIDPIVYAAVLETNSEAINPGRALLGWKSTRQERDAATGETEYWYVHHAENEDNPDQPLEFAGHVLLAADGAVTADIDGQQVFSGPSDELAVRSTYTGIVPLVYKAQNELMKSLYSSYAWAFALIVAMMIPPLWRMAGMWKSFPAAIWVMLPNYYPTAIVFGTMGTLGVPLDVGTMMTASVALGIALDDTVHYLAWFDHGMKKFGMTREEACRYAYKTCAVSMMQTTVIACIGMSVFVLSTFQPTMQFGLFMVPLMAVALFGDLVILPAMLTSPIGRLFVRGVKQKRSAVAGYPADAERLERSAEHSGNVRVGQPLDERIAPHAAARATTATNA